MLPRIWFASIWLMAVIGLPAMGAAQSAHARELRVGMLAFQGETAALARWSETIAYMRTHLPQVRFTLLPLTLDGMAAALEAGELDIVFTNPGHYALTADDHRLAPMLTLRSDRPGAPVTGNRFGAVIFARADAPDIRTLADLKGKSFAAVAPEAFGGYLISADTLRRNGLVPEDDLGQLLFLGFPQSSIIEAVLAGEAQSGTVRTGLIEAMEARGAVPPGALRVLNPLKVPGFDLALSTALVPEWTVAATPRLDGKLRRKIVVAMLSMAADDPAAVAGGYGGWTTPMNDTPVRTILAQTLSNEATARQNPLNLALLGLLALALALAVLLALRRRVPVLAATQDHEADDLDDVQLTPREREILSLIEKGLTTKQIARDLDISPKTVEFHRGHIMRKFDASTMAEVVHRDRR